jgi:hypothetical protein
VSGSFSLTDNPELVLSVPGVTSVPNYLSLESEAKATSFPNLTSVGNLYVSGTSPTTLAFPALTSAGQVRLQYTTSLNTFSLPQLTGLDYLYLYYNSSALGVSLPVITSMQGLDVDGGVGGVDLPNLATARYVNYYNTPLTAISLPSLTSITDQLSLTYNYSLATFSAPLSSHTNSVFIYYNYAFPQCRAEQIAAALTPTSSNIWNNNYSATCP